MKVTERLKKRNILSYGRATKVNKSDFEKIFFFKIIAKFVKKWPKIAHFFRNFVIFMIKFREFEISDLLTI